MEVSRRALLAAPVIVAVAGTSTAQTPSTPNAFNPATPSPPPASVLSRLVARAKDHIHPIAFDGHQFSGPGWDLLVREGAEADYFLVGEEHGLAEIPVLTGALFAALHPAGYEKLAIEISPTIASELDRESSGGFAQLARYLRQIGPGPAFFNWQSEAELLVKVRSMARRGQQAIVGLDYEVLADRRLMDMLRPHVPATAKTAFMAFDSACQEGWKRWKSQGNPDALPMFSVEPALALALVEAWKSPSPAVAEILELLVETLEINKLQRTTGWGSNQRRALYNRKNFISQIVQQTEGRWAKTILKFGANHMMRGVSWTGVFDIGSLASEAATLRGGKSFHLVVGGGIGGAHGQMDATVIQTKSVPTDMFADGFGLGFLLDVLPKNGLGLLDLRPLRSIATSQGRLKELNNPEAVRVIHSFDAMLVWNQSTAATQLP